MECACTAELGNGEIGISTTAEPNSCSCSGESFCYSSFQDDVGNEEKFTEMGALQLQNLLVCAEMFIAAIMHRTVFSYRDWKNARKQSSLAGVRDMLMPADIVRDVRNLTGKVLAERGEVGGSRKDSVTCRCCSLLHQMTIVLRCLSRRPAHSQRWSCSLQRLGQQTGAVLAAPGQLLSTARS